MAIYMNYNRINEYMRIGASKDSCYICSLKKGATAKRDAYDTMKSFEGNLENQKVVAIKKSGIDVCICMDCVKVIYDEHIAPKVIKEDTCKVEETPVTEEVKPKTEKKK